jgi:2,6-dihydroxypyridine 3-monooxygenase
VPARCLRYLSRDEGVASESPCAFRFTSYYALYRDLIGCFDPDRYHLGSEVVGFDAAADAVEVALAHGTTVRCDLLVCADGVRSSARARLVPEVSPRYAGYVGWRGAVAHSELPSELSAALEDAITYCVIPNSHLLAYPIPGADGRRGVRAAAMNWVWYRNVTAGDELAQLLTDRNGVRRSVSVPPGFVQERYRAELASTAGDVLPGPLAELLARTPDPFVQGVYDVNVPRMAFGRICLIGDAAFALRPHIAAGTAKAAEDAWRLGRSMAGAKGDVEAALREWQPHQLALGRSAQRRTREAGERSQFSETWRVGDPLPFGLYEQGDSSLPP